MKKSTIWTTGILCSGLLLVGCTTPANPANISRKLENNLTNLTNVVNKMDTIDNTYLTNPDIHPQTMISSAPAENSNRNFVASISEDITPAKNKFKNKVANIDTYKNDNNKEIKIFQYTIEPTKYSPRYLNSTNSENDDYLGNYINKVRTLYAITNDAIEANNELDKYKNNVITYCVEIKQLNNSIENGTFEPNNNQISALNNYIEDLKITIKRIRNCNGDLTNEVNNINNTDVGGLTAGIDVINSNYLSVLNHIDTRIAYLKNAITTLEQVKYLLQEAQAIYDKNPELQPSIKEESTPEDIVEKEDYSSTTDTNQSTENQNYANEENPLNEGENNNVNDDEIVVENQNNNTHDNTQEINDINTEIKETNTNNQSNIDTTDKNIEIENIENETIKNEEATTLELEKQDKESVKETNIDTYLNTNNNLDTYKKEEEKIVENTSQNVVTDTITNTTPIVNNNTTHIPLQTPTVDENKINAPNGTFQNGIITQNNLNSGVNNGVNGNHTGSGYTNMPYVNNGINSTNKNVDTYGQNTIIDMLNHGTVNNGINTLNISEKEKPTMVNGSTVSSLDDCKNCEENNTCEECKKENKLEEDSENNYGIQTLEER